MLDAPMFTTRWRWVAGVSLALPRFRGGKKVPPQFLRMQAEDLVAAVFPDQIACAENLVGEREVPDHPLTNQAIGDCLHEAMDIEGLERLLAPPRSGRHSRRRLRSDRALAARARGAVGEALRLPRRRAARGAADPGGHGPALAAIRRARPILAGSIRRRSPGFAPRPGPIRSTPRSCTTRCCGWAALTEAEARAAPAWREWLDALGARQARRAVARRRRRALWIPAERLTQFQALWPDARLEPEIAPPADQAGATLVARAGAGRDPARQARGPRAGHADGA